MTNIKIMIKFPFYSIDSSGWVSWAKFNSFMFFKNWQLRSCDAEQSRRLYSIDYWKMDYVDKLLNAIVAYEWMQDYVTKLHRAKWMEYRK
jgi:hypothetical protein